MVERLSPSESAAKMHANWIHLQAIIWASLGKATPAATDWGWKLVHEQLIPIAVDGPLTPDHVLNIIRCKCKGNCSTASCSCRKHGLHCVTACSNCTGTECNNVHFTDVTHPDDDSDSEPESEPMTICEGDVGEFFIRMSLPSTCNMKKKSEFFNPPASFCIFYQVFNWSKILVPKYYIF